MKLLIFDFDGTLADTSRAILLTIATTLAELGQKPAPGADFTPCIGLPLAKIFERACATRDEKLISRAVRIYRERFPEKCQASVRLFPGVREGLRELREAGLVPAIASSRGKNSLLALTDLLGITGHFSCIAGEEDAAHPKPAPDIAELVAKQAGISPASALFIGDTVFDIGCGKAAGMGTCGVSWGNHTKAQLLDAGADLVIDSFSELPAVIRQLGSR